MSGHTVQTQIRLIRVYTVCKSLCIFWMHYSKETPFCSTFRVIGVRHFRIFTVHVIWAASWQNQQNGMCTKRRLRSAWASAQSDQSLHYALNGYLRTHGFFMRTAKTLDQYGQMPRLIGVFAGHTCHFVGFVMRWLICWFCLCIYMYVQVICLTRPVPLSPNEPYMYILTCIKQVFRFYFLGACLTQVAWLDYTYSFCDWRDTCFILYNASTAFYNIRNEYNFSYACTCTLFKNNVLFFFILCTKYDKILALF